MSGGPSALDPEPTLPAHPSNNSFGSTLYDLTGENDEPALTREGLEEQHRFFDLLTQPSQSPPNYGVPLTTRAPSPTSEDDGDLLRPANVVTRGRSMASEASDVTLVDEQQPSTVYPAEGDEGKTDERHDGADTEAVLWVLRLCGVWAMTRALLGLLAYCGVRVGPRRNGPSTAAKKVCIDEELRPEGRAAARPGRRRTRNAGG